MKLRRTRTYGVHLNEGLVCGISLTFDHVPVLCVYVFWLSRLLNVRRRFTSFLLHCFGGYQQTTACKSRNGAKR